MKNEKKLEEKKEEVKKPFFFSKEGKTVWAVTLEEAKRKLQK